MRAEADSSQLQPLSFQCKGFLLFVLCHCDDGLKGKGIAVVWRHAECFVNVCLCFIHRPTPEAPKHDTRTTRVIRPLRDSLMFSKAAGSRLFRKLPSIS